MEAETGKTWLCFGTLEFIEVYSTILGIEKHGGEATGYFGREI